MWPHSRSIGFLFFAAHILFEYVASKQLGEPCEIPSTKEQGICKRDHECPVANNFYKKYRIRPTYCNLDDSTPVVCCGSEDSTPAPESIGAVSPRATTKRPEPPQNTRSKQGSAEAKRISETKCAEYSAPVKQVSVALGLSLEGSVGSVGNSKCIYSEPLIVGGEDTGLGEFPHMAVIGWPLAVGGYAWGCGGSLVSPDAVLTAAHCTGAYNMQLVIGDKPTVVRLGEHNLLRDDDGADPQDIAIKEIIRHPEFLYPSKYHDIAIMKLRFPADFGSMVRPCCLWQEPGVTKNTLIATGWGNVGFTEQESPTLRKVAVGVIEQDVCRQQYVGGDRKLRDGIVDSQLCAGSPMGGKDTCEGDSGGPLQQTKDDSVCIFYLVGVTSFGSGCANKNSAGVYTRVSSYLDWIESVVWPEEATAAE